MCHHIQSPTVVKSPQLHLEWIFISTSFQSQSTKIVGYDVDILSHAANIFHYSAIIKHVLC